MADIEITVANRIARITLNRPDRLNAITDNMFDVLLEEVPKLAHDTGVGVVVLQGAGRGFCAGADVTKMEGTASQLGFEARAIRLQRRHEIGNLLHTMNKPTISRIQGVAVGAGVGMAMACDLRIAGPDASFMTGFARLAFSGDFGLPYLLSRQLGEARALELLLTSEKVGAEQAAAWGMVSKLVAAEELDATVDALAEQFANGAPLAYAAIKRNFAAVRGATFRQFLDIEAYSQISLVLTEDHNEAVAAFKDKRKPRFVGR